MNLWYSDVRYVVYRWGFLCLDYSFGVLISQIGNLGLYNWFYRIYLLPPFLFFCICAHDTIFNACSWTRIYRYTCACLCTPLGIHHTTRWGVLTPLDLHVEMNLDRDGLPGDQSCAVVASWINSWPSETLSFQALCSSLEFSFCNSWALLYCS